MPTDVRRDRRASTHDCAILTPSNLANRVDLPRGQSGIELSLSRGGKSAQRCGKKGPPQPNKPRRYYLSDNL